jgi:hypothetical protein
LHAKNQAAGGGTFTASVETSVMTRTFAIAVAALCWIAPALADDATPDSDHGRYTFNKVDDGYLRLDTRSGDVSVCRKHEVGWACQAAPQDRAVLENEIARLRTDNAALKKELLAHGLPLPAGTMPEVAGGGDASVTLRLPDNADVDQAVAFVGRMWQRLVDAIARAQKQALNKS